MEVSPVPCPSCSAPVAPYDPLCPWCHAPQPHRDVLAPQVVIDRGDSRIVVDSRIGEGAMGTVWRAWRFHAPTPGQPGGRERPAEPLALKVLRGRPTPAMRELFVREAEALRRLSHPNAVGYHDLFDYQGVLVLALEYVDGETLGAIIDRHREPVVAGATGGHVGLPCLPFLRAWVYFQQLLGALAAVHAFGMVHRDVKPANVLVRRDGLVKLGDFGIARIRGAVSLAATRDFAPGTGAYMSPEQVMSQPLDGRSDLYSAGIVLYEMLAGTTPFSSDRPEFLIRQDQIVAPPPPIRSLVPQAPPVLDRLFARALAKSPADRFESAIAMGDAFRSALGIADSPEWRAQAAIAHTAKTIADVPIRERATAAMHEAKLVTLREFVSHSYKTQKLASL